MKRKYKITGCAKFFFILIILAPLAYLGASYYNGENGIQNIKDFLGIESNGNSTDNAGQDTETYNMDDIKDLKKIIKTKEKSIEKLESKNEELVKQVNDLKLEIKHLRQNQQDPSNSE